MRAGLALLALAAGTAGFATRVEAAPYDSARRWKCNPTTGLAAPLKVCSPDDPCVGPAPELTRTPITTASVKPACHTTAAGAPAFDDGPPLEWTDPAGVVRYACLYRPPSASPAAPRPLVVWLHGGGGGLADGVYNHTTLRAKAESFDLTGDCRRPGFFLLSVQGRNLHYPTDFPRDGHHHDFYFRDLASPSSNPDIANLDRLMDQVAAGGSVDWDRIYVVGWSNGGFFAQLYAIARHATSTPGGQRVAAAVGYSAADPFNNINLEHNPSCQLEPYPRSAVPILILGHACDFIVCSTAQADFWRAKVAIEPGYAVEPWIADLKQKVQIRT